MYSLSCWVKCSINVDCILLVIGVEFFCIFKNFLSSSINFCKRDVEVSNYICLFSSCSFHSTNFAAVFGSYTFRIVVSSWKVSPLCNISLYPWLSSLFWSQFYLKFILLLLSLISFNVVYLSLSLYLFYCYLIISYLMWVFIHKVGLLQTACSLILFLFSFFFKSNVAICHLTGMCMSLIFKVISDTFRLEFTSWLFCVFFVFAFVSNFFFCLSWFYWASLTSLFNFFAEYLIYT